MLTTGSALIVVDMQEDLCRDGRRRLLVEEMLPGLTALIRDCLDAAMPVVFTQFWLPPDDPQFRRFGDTYCVAGTPGADIITELRGFLAAVTLIRKPKHSAFFDTPLEGILREQRITEVALTGLQTHICIMTTAADASYRGFAPVALDDLVVSSTATKKSDALEWISTYVGTVESSARFRGRKGIEHH